MSLENRKQIQKECPIAIEYDKSGCEDCVCILCNRKRNDQDCQCYICKQKDTAKRLNYCEYRIDP